MMRKRKLDSVNKRRHFAAAAALALATGWLTLAQGWSSPYLVKAAEPTRSNGLYSALYHNSYDSLYRTPFGADPTGMPVTLRLLGPASITAAKIDLTNVNANFNATATIAMRKVTRALLVKTVGAGKVKAYSLWEGIIPAQDVQVPGILNYQFTVKAGRQVAYYGNNGNGYGGVGAGATTPDEVLPYRVTVYAKSFTTPNWLVHGLIYEIFPDRFYNGNKANDENPATQKAIGQGPDGGEALVPVQFHKNWYDSPDDPNVNANPSDPNYQQEQRLRGNGSWSTDYFGGDLRGIIDKLDYLQSLGVNTLYLTPIFQAESNHKYDTGNFYEIDPGFGTLQTFKELLAAAKARHMHVLLDGVFEDTGSDSMYFNKFGSYKSTGAWQQFKSRGVQKSPYYNWFTWALGGTSPYLGWGGTDILPLANTSAKGWQQFVYGTWDPSHPTDPATNAVARYWVSMGTAGWRLDSANNNNFTVAWWTAFRKAVKQVNPNAAIIGEDWNDATNDNGTDWLTGTTWDSTMNYSFRNAVISFFRGSYNDGNLQNYAMDASTFGVTLMQLLEEYPKPALYAEMNLLDSHDTERILTILEGAPDASSTTANQQAIWQPTVQEKATGIRKLELVTDFQYGFVGVPMIYYGDEAGMIGYKDPLDRKTYPWGRVDQTLINHFRLLARIRQVHPVLQSGGFQQLYAQGRTYAFARTDRAGRDALGMIAKDDTAVVAINAGAAETLRINVSSLLQNGVKLYDALHGNRVYTVQHGVVTIPLAAADGAMLFTS